MKKCVYYIEQKVVYNWPYNNTPVIVPMCDGTKERDECSCGGDPTKCDFYPEFRKAALEVQEPKFGEWISVEDRLPKSKVNCLVHYKHSYCDDDGYYAIGVSFYDGKEFQIGLAYNVTHWMPLPEPPIEKEN